LPTRNNTAGEDYESSKDDDLFLPLPEIPLLPSNIDRRSFLMRNAAAPGEIMHSATFHFGRGLAYGIINIYLVKTASVFMITTSTIALYTRLTPRWLAVGGYVVAVVLLIGSYYFDWSLLVFPLLSILRDREVVEVTHTTSTSD